ncbi:N-acetylmuramate alpha-1-phosphate uridylyltransferase MurU [Accumulibacter sp.]|uniref:N-acetylmuramate alpha-1-phosphate uridylyltransferase MurU n=1 Tax=Accumulibacter sp. TaxID=2053492 RepID=UPI0025F17575|nr:nucleotidyltransferase family protein [Accumulibacter sp.]MCM8595431.1 nucleotidyltransferase family protein [Accumulibacter sp.]MCM8626388.1 nucleotidyltransferase family protein [Accumulibacter sp.]MDS4049578.1 nucleotidyltransferase family protein [Accumulibacter sp.]
MKAMILAAGRGERLRPLTDTIPKPLLPVGGKALIAWHLERLAGAGWREVVINHAHLGERIEAALGNGRSFGLSIAYSPEPTRALETAGGIRAALPLLGDQPFLTISADVWCDWTLGEARTVALASDGRLAHLVLVDNPPHHPEGDFCLSGNRVQLAAGGGTTLTFSGIAVFWPAFFAEVPAGAVIKLRPLLETAIAHGLVTGQRHAGRWVDVGTPQRLAELDSQLTASS